MTYRVLSDTYESKILNQNGCHLNCHILGDCELFCIFYIFGLSEHYYCGSSDPLFLTICNALSRTIYFYSEQNDIFTLSRTTFSFTTKAVRAGACACVCACVRACVRNYLHSLVECATHPSRVLQIKYIFLVRHRSVTNSQTGDFCYSTVNVCGIFFAVPLFL